MAAPTYHQTTAALAVEETHHVAVIDAILGFLATPEQKFTYTFHNFFHPRVDELREILNRYGLQGLFDPHRLEALTDEQFFPDRYDRLDLTTVGVEHEPAGLDLDPSMPYAVYNWELLFHVPLTIAVHLSKNQRFAEADRWFRFVFDPGGTGDDDPAPDRYWRFPAFRTGAAPHPVVEQVELLAREESELTEAESVRRQALLNALWALRRKPFQPHAAARAFGTRAYQWQAVMKYLDNLIAWGDFYFAQDTMETLGLATQRYVMAANVLGERPQRIAPPGNRRARTFHELRQAGLDELGNALVELETSFPFNASGPPGGSGAGSAGPGGSGAQGSALLGIGRTLYFCVPPNDRLLAYWDTVADRLHKLRHCMNIHGVVRQLPLFDPPLDPGMLVKAAAAGIDVSSIVAGLHQPPSPVRARKLLDKAIGLASELRGYGQAVSSALERQDAEELSLLRQRHETRLAELGRDTRYLSWKQTEASTEALLRTRDGARLRYEYAARLLGFEIDTDAVPETLPLERRPMTEETFDEVYDALVGTYGGDVGGQELPALRLAEGSSPSQAAGAEGTGPLYLIRSEHAELNEHLPAARDWTLFASITELAAPILGLIPDFDVDLHYWGLGASSTVFGGTKLAAAAEYAAQLMRTKAAWERDEAGIAQRTAALERRADEWVERLNATASELQALGRQVIASLIAEEVARHEYETTSVALEHAREVDEHLHEKFTNRELYAWMQGETGRLYYEYYRLALDVARKAERAVKAELMRPALDGTDFVAFNHWDGGRRGALAGDRLLLDLRRLQEAYDEHNTYDHELTRHVSLRRLDPLALLQLKVTGSCEVSIPEWFFDVDRPGHYLRRIRRVEVTTDPVLAPHTPVHLTAALVSSSVRTSPLAGDGYERGEEDTRFVDYVGPVASIVTSGASADAGYAHAPGDDDRRTPFELAGAVSTWRFELPDLRAFDYGTLTDVVLTIVYSAREGGAALAGPAAAHAREQVSEAGAAGRTLLVSLRHDQPNDWASFRAGDQPFPLRLTPRHFPFWAQHEGLALGGEVRVYGVAGGRLVSKAVAVPDAARAALTAGDGVGFALDADDQVLRRDLADAWVLVPYHLA
jgi:hypothetical protein